MFALIAAIIWFLSAFGVHLGGVSLLTLGLAFLALHFAFGTVLPLAPASWRREQQP